MELISRMRNRVNGVREIWTFDNRWEVIMHRLLFPETGMVTYRKGELEFVVDHAGGDAPGTRACLVSNMYRALLPHMDLRGRPLNLLDIGANGGGFPLMLLAEGLELGRLTAVEMNPRTYSRLQLNVTQNIAAPATLIHGAVCGEACSLTLSLGRGSTGESLQEASAGSAGGRVCQVQGLTLDEVVARGFGDAAIDLCKIDIEGAEYDVFAATTATALRQARYLIIEIHQVPGKRPQEVHAALQALGFREILRERQTADDVFCFENTAR